MDAFLSRDVTVSLFLLFFAVKAKKGKLELITLQVSDGLGNHGLHGTQQAASFSLPSISYSLLTNVNDIGLLSSLHTHTHIFCSASMSMKS